MSLNKYIDVFLSAEKEIFRVKAIKDQDIAKNLTYKFWKDKVVLKGDPIILIGQNVNYYNGASHFWNKAKANTGLEFEDEGIPTKIDKVNKKEQEVDFFKDLCEAKQEISDEKMEFYTFSNMLELGAEKMIGGYAKKVHQSQGPFLIKFKQTPKNPVTDKEHRIYLKVDGEHYYIVQPREIKVYLNENYPKGSVKFLVNN